MTTRRLFRYRTRGDLAAAVAERLVAALVEIQERQPLSQLCLCGGETAMAVYGEMARLAPGSGLDMTRLEIWWSDETYSATGQDDRNAGRLLAVLGAAVHLTPARTHAMPARTNVDADDAALQYAAELGATKFDLCLLSIGRRGEVAALADGEATYTSPVVAVDGWGDAPSERLTLTYPTLNRSAEVWVLASGADKAEAVATALGGETPLPASRVGGRRATKWFLDAEAAAKLPRYNCRW